MLCRVEVLTRWSSLSDQVGLANGLFGPPAGEQKVAEWLAEQMGLVEDIEFAQQFAAHVALPGVSALDYTHRHIRTTRGELIGGIRFYARTRTSSTSCASTPQTRCRTVWRPASTPTWSTVWRPYRRSAPPSTEHDQHPEPLGGVDCPSYPTPAPLQASTIRDSVRSKKLCFLVSTTGEPDEKSCHAHTQSAGTTMGDF
jgi:hypothetical protein